MDWTDDYYDLLDYFKSIELPTEPIQVNECATIMDIKHYLRAHFKILQAQNGNKAYLPYLENLKSLKKILENDTGRNQTGTAGDSEKFD